MTRGCDRLFCQFAPDLPLRPCYEAWIAAARCDETFGFCRVIRNWRWVFLGFQVLAARRGMRLFHKQGKLHVGRGKRRADICSLHLVQHVAFQSSDGEPWMPLSFLPTRGDTTGEWSSPIIQYLIHSDVWALAILNRSLRKAEDMQVWTRFGRNYCAQVSLSGSRH
jgi:hypothetical protein